MDELPFDEVIEAVLKLHAAMEPEYAGHVVEPVVDLLRDVHTLRLTMFDRPDLAKERAVVATYNSLGIAP